MDFQFAGLMLYDVTIGTYILLFLNSVAQIILKSHIGNLMKLTRVHEVYPRMTKCTHQVIDPKIEPVMQPFDRQVDHLLK